MKYCLFCRDSFEDEMETCPYCGDALVDELPDPFDEDGQAPLEIEALDEGEAGEDAPLMQVLIAQSAEDLTAAVEVLKNHGIYFEIEETERTEAGAGIVGGRAWRLLAAADEAERAFLKLVEEAPQLFPHEVREAFEREDEPEKHVSEALARIPALLACEPAEENTEELSKAIVDGFTGEDAEAMARAKFALAVEGARTAPLLAAIAAEAIAAGGEGAERLLFNAVDVLDALGYSEGLALIEPLYDSEVSQVRARAAYAAGRLGSPGAVERLLGLLDDPDEDVRYEASESIWRLTGMDFDFDPYGPLEEERANIEKIRSAWRAGGAKGVRNRRTLDDLLGENEEAED